MSRLREFALKILLRKEKGIMAVIYATLIVKGKKTLDQVPALIRKQVEEILKDLEVEVGNPAPLIFVGRLKGGSDGPAYYASRA